MPPAGEGAHGAVLDGSFCRKRRCDPSFRTLPGRGPLWHSGSWALAGRLRSLPCVPSGAPQAGGACGGRGAGAKEGAVVLQVPAELTGPSAREAAGAHPVPTPTSAPAPGRCSAGRGLVSLGERSGVGGGRQPGRRYAPLLQVMAGLGAPDASHRRTAVVPSVTVVSAGSRVNAGATSRQRSWSDAQRAEPRRSLQGACSTPSPSLGRVCPPRVCTTGFSLPPGLGSSPGSEKPSLTPGAAPPPRGLARCRAVTPLSPAELLCPHAAPLPGGPRSWQRDHLACPPRGSVPEPDGPRGPDPDGQYTFAE